MLDGEGLAHGDGDGVAHDGDSEGISDHAGEERGVRNQGGLQPRGVVIYLLAFMLQIVQIVANICTQPY